MILIEHVAALLLKAVVLNGSGVAWCAPFCETECSATVCRSLQIAGRTGAGSFRVSPAGETEAGSAGDQPAILIFRLRQGGGPYIPDWPTVVS